LSLLGVGSCGADLPQLLFSSWDLLDVGDGSRDGHRFRRCPDLKELLQLVNLCLHLGDCTPHLGA
jgi:hypothetical protein